MYSVMLDPVTPNLHCGLLVTRVEVIDSGGIDRFVDGTVQLKTCQGQVNAACSLMRTVDCEPHP